MRCVASGAEGDALHTLSLFCNCFDAYNVVFL